MDTARLFQSGRNQAVRLPKDYRFRGSEVAVKHLQMCMIALGSTHRPRG
jgi:virulence-associated protein VagC